VVDQAEFRVTDVVVDRLRHPCSHQVDPALARQAGDLARRVHRVVAPDVEEVADLVGLHHADQPLEVLSLVLPELVPAAADRSRCRGEAQALDLLAGLPAQVDHLFPQQPLDPMPRGVERSDPIGIVRAGFDHSLKRGVDHRRGTAGLGDDSVEFHQVPPKRTLRESG